MTKDKMRKIFSLALTAVLSVIGTLACVVLLFLIFPELRILYGWLFMILGASR